MSIYYWVVVEDPRVLLSSDSPTMKVFKEPLPRMELNSVAEPLLLKLLLPEKKDLKVNPENKEDLKVVIQIVSLSAT